MRDMKHKYRIANQVLRDKSEAMGAVLIERPNTLQPNLETLAEIAKCSEVNTKDLLWSIKN